MNFANLKSAAPTALIADDEPLLREQIKLRLAKLWPELVIVAEATNGAEAWRECETHRPDIAFLDIHMPVMNGLDAARLIWSRKRNEDNLDHEGDGGEPVARRADDHVGPQTQIVFITAFDEHAIAAFERGAIDYLLKPFNEVRLTKTIQRLKERLDERPGNRIQTGVSASATGKTAAYEDNESDADANKLSIVLRQLTAQIKPAAAYLQWIKASVGQTVRLIPIQDVYYFQSDEKYTRVVLEDSEVLIRKPIKELLEELDPERFWQIHRSTIVSTQAIAGVMRGLRDQADLKLKGRPETLTVSRNYTHLFKQM